MVEVACKDEDRFKVPYKSMEMPNKKPYLDKNNMILILFTYVCVSV